MLSVNKQTVAFLIAKLKVALANKDLVYASEIQDRLFALIPDTTYLTRLYWQE